MKKDSNGSNEVFSDNPLALKIRGFFLRVSERVRSFLRNEKRRRLRAALEFLQSLARDNIIGIAAQTAFFLLLSLFPLIAVASAVLSQYSDVLGNELFSYFLPEPVVEVLIPLIDEIGNRELSGEPILSVLLSLWSGSTGIWALMKGICKAYTGEYPQMAIVKRLIALLFVVVFLLLLAIGLSFWVIGSGLISKTGGIISTLIYPLKYLGAFFGILIFNLGLYSYTPGYDLSKSNLLPGAFAASAGWMVANVGFEIYIKHFKNYSAIYGSIGAFLGLLLWLFVISAVILVGAEINAAVFLFRAKSDVGPKG